MDKDEMKKPIEPIESEKDGRRDVMKKAVVVGGMTVAVSQWTQPVVDSVILPSHAQATFVLTAGIIVP